VPVIHLVRHGQASAHAADYDVLSELGDAQSRLVGRELARRGLRDPLVVCGTLRRQRDTADALIEAAGLAAKAEPDARWNEYDHLALLAEYPHPDGGAAASLQDLIDSALTAWLADPDGTWPDFVGGAAAALRDLVAALGRGRDGIVVTSGGVIAAVAGSLLGLSAAGVVALNRVTVNTGVTTVTSGASGLSLLTFNDHAHLAGGDRRQITYR
jgi:broad specificity phosphatase PhoE